MHSNFEMIGTKNRFQSQYSLKPGSIMGNTENHLIHSAKLQLIILKMVFSRYVVLELKVLSSHTSLHSKI